MSTPRSIRTTRKSSRFEKLRKRITLKAVMKGASWCFTAYKAVSRMIDWYNQLID